MGDKPAFCFGRAMNTVSEEIRAVASRVAEASGVSVIDVAARRRGSSWQFEVMIDKPGGVSVGDCARVAADLRPRVVGLGLVDGSFRLQVNSPGLDRPLKCEADFTWAMGRVVKAVTSELVEGQTSHRGRVEKVESGTVVLDCGEGVMRRIPVSGISRARLEVELR